MSVPVNQICLVENPFITLLQSRNRLSFDIFRDLQLVVVYLISFSHRIRLILLEYRIDLQLRPSEITSLSFINDCPPISTFENTFDEIGIVTKTDESFIGGLLVRSPDIHSIGIVKFPQKVMIQH